MATAIQTTENGLVMKRSGPKRVAKERVGSAVAASILGLEMRTVQERADLGRIPSAIREGRKWTFNEATLRAYVAAKEIEHECPTTFTAAKASGGLEPKSTAKNYVKAYEQQISARRRSS